MPPEPTLARAPEQVDLEHLLKLRLIVARVGEMDNARWWNTKGQLGRLGAMALRRGFPRTHRFAQARSVFAVASARCAEVFDPPRSVTLWTLPADLEEEFDARWEHWLDSASEWEPFFQEIESIKADGLIAASRTLGLASEEDVAAIARLRRGAEGRSVPVSREFTGSIEDVRILALAFSKGETGALAVPYMAARP